MARAFARLTSSQSWTWQRSTSRRADSSRPTRAQRARRTCSRARPCRPRWLRASPTRSHHQRPSGGSRGERRGSRRRGETRAPLCFAHVRLSGGPLRDGRVDRPAARRTRGGRGGARRIRGRARDVARRHAARGPHPRRQLRDVLQHGAGCAGRRRARHRPAHGRRTRKRRPHRPARGDSVPRVALIEGLCVYVDAQTSGVGRRGTLAPTPQLLRCAPSHYTRSARHTVSVRLG
jgi:hypothetical protein